MAARFTLGEGVGVGFGELAAYVEVATCKQITRTNVKDNINLKLLIFIYIPKRLFIELELLFKAAPKPATSIPSKSLIAL